jgi:hypothetical protein
MRLRLGQLTIRRLMLLVMSVALSLSLVLAAMRAGRLATDYQAKANWFATYENGNMVSEANIERERTEAVARGDASKAEHLTALLAEARGSTAWYAQKRWLYQYAASHPWLPLPAELQTSPFPHLLPNPGIPR